MHLSELDKVYQEGCSNSAYAGDPCTDVRHAVTHFIAQFMHDTIQYIIFIHTFACMIMGDVKI